MSACIAPAARVEAEVDRIATAYRESPNLLAYLRTVLGQVANAADAICRIPDAFDLDTAVGDQLTILGKDLGFPRRQCQGQLRPVFGYSAAGFTGTANTSGPFFGFACDEAAPPPRVTGFCGGSFCPEGGEPAFGFECETDIDPTLPVVGFCGDETSTWFGCVDSAPAECEVGCESIVPVEGYCSDGSWFDCDGPRFDDYTFTDDDLYRRYLKVRRYQILGLYDLDSLTAAIRGLWGPAAYVATMDGGSVTLASGRLLSNVEKQILPVTVQVLPIAPGIRRLVHIDAGPVFGFGQGWGGLCDSVWLNPQSVTD